MLMIVGERSELRIELKRVLSRAGVSIFISESAEEAYGEALRRHPGAVLLDAAMPELESLAALRLLRTDERTSNIPAVVYGATEPVSGRAWAQAIGARSYVRSPFSAADVLMRIAEAGAGRSR